MKKSLFNKLFCGLAIFSSLFLTSCGVIEDVNGESDFTIATITEEDILGSSSYMTTMCVESTKKVDGVTEYSISCSSFSGVMRVLKPKCSTLSVSSSVTKGNFMVAVIKDDKIVNKVEANENKTLNLDSSTYHYVKLVGESAQFECKIIAK